MATKPLDLNEKVDRPIASVAARMVTQSITKYVNYLVSQADRDIDLLIVQARKKANNQCIEVADHFYNQIPEEFR